MLSYPIPTKVLQQLLSDEASKYRTLREALEQVVADDQARTTTFADLPADSLRDRSAPGWGTVLRALDAVQECEHLTSVAVTKILHRKRPNLVPIVDSRLRSFYGVSGMGYAALFDRIHEDLRRSGQLIDELRSDYRLENGNPMSALRALDIVAWMAEKK